MANNIRRIEKKLLQSISENDNDFDKRKNTKRFLFVLFQLDNRLAKKKRPRAQSETNFGRKKTSETRRRKTNA